MTKAGVYTTTAWRKQALHDLSDCAYKVIGCLLNYMNIYTGEACPARETIGEDTGKSVSTVSRAVAELEAKNYVLTRIVPSKTGQFTHNNYRLLHFNLTEKKMLADIDKEEGDKYDIIKKYTGVS